MKTNTQKENLLAIESIVKAIANSKNTLQTARQNVQDVLPLIVEGLRGKDFEKVARILFEHIGKTTFYALYLRDFFKSQHFILDFDRKKDVFTWFGDFSTIKPEKYLDYFEAQKEERKKEFESMSKEKRIEKTFSTRLEKLKKDELEYLAKLINTKLHKTI